MNARERVCGWRRTVVVALLVGGFVRAIAWQRSLRMSDHTAHKDGCPLCIMDTKGKTPDEIKRIYTKMMDELNARRKAAASTAK